MRMLFRRASTAAVLLIVLAPSATAQIRGFVPADYYRIVNVGEVAVSPRGDRVVFTVTRVVEEENRRHRELWEVGIRNGQPDGDPVRITDPTRDASSPSWSPDGSLLAFSSRRGGADGSSTWFLRMDGRGGEAFRIEGVNGTPVWSPDMRWIAYAGPPGGAEATDEEANAREGWIAPDAVTRTLDEERFDGRVITSMRYKSDGVLTLRPHFSVRPKNQLFVVAAAGGEPRQVTDVGFDVGGIAWSLDNRIVFFSGDEDEDDELSVENTRNLYAVAASGGRVRALTQNPGSQSDVAVAPDGDRIAFTFSAERGAKSEIMVVSVSRDGTFRSTPLALTSEWELDIGAPRWSADGRSIYFSTAIGGNNHLFRVPADGGAVEQVTHGDRRLGDFSFSQDERVMAYVADDAVTPTELFLARADGTSERRATGFNDDWLRSVTRMPAERLTWRVSDGTEIEGWVITPVGFEPGGEYPVILKIHGGPHSAYGNTFFPTFHVLSNAGFLVFYSNPRGSSGYGHDFQYATREQWGIMDKEDLLKGLDAVHEKYPEADAGRVGVSGGSYGGFMSNWLTATTDRFHASVTSRSITNWESWWGTSDVPGLTEWEFSGAPWEQRDLYRRLSPISYVENVTAPTLIIHSENDFRTPMADAEQWFMSLMKRGVPVEFVRYPRSSHGLSRTGEPWLLVDRMERIASWFEHYLIEHPPMARTNGWDSLRLRRSVSGAR